MRIGVKGTLAPGADIRGGAKTDCKMYQPAEGGRQFHAMQISLHAALIRKVMYTHFHMKFTSQVVQLIREPRQ